MKVGALLLVPGLSLEQGGTPQRRYGRAALGGWEVRAGALSEGARQRGGPSAIPWIGGLESKG
jgi:hypothetical protein